MFVSVNAVKPPDVALSRRPCYLFLAGWPLLVFSHKVFKGCGVTVDILMYLPLETNLVGNKEYVVVVRAINKVGLTVQAMSNGIIVDLTAPLPGHVWIVKPEHGMKQYEISAR